VEATAAAEEELTVAGAAAEEEAKAGADSCALATPAWLRRFQNIQRSAVGGANMEIEGTSVDSVENKTDKEGSAADATDTAASPSFFDTTYGELSTQGALTLATELGWGNDDAVLDIGSGEVC
jgi:hypothetical protein